MKHFASKGIVSVVVLSLSAVVAVSVSGCGSSDDDVQKAVDHAIQEERESERQRDLEREQRKLKRELRALKRDKGRSGGGSGSSTSSCGDGISVNSNTTCPFARNVAEEFRQSGPGSISVWSPTTDRYYAMYCSGTSPTRCTGGNSALVIIR